jgi:hypothetical protein
MLFSYVIVIQGFSNSSQAFLIRKNPTGKGLFHKLLEIVLSVLDLPCILNPLFSDERRMILCNLAINYLLSLSLTGISLG